MYIARARNRDASLTPCMSIARIRCGWCSSSNGPIAPLCWLISRCRLRAISSVRCSRSPPQPRPSRFTTPQGWKAFEADNAWLDCHTNFILQCNMRALGISDQTRGPDERRLEYQVWTRGASGAIRRRWMKPSSPRSASPTTRKQQAEIAASLMGLPIESVTRRSEEGRPRCRAFFDPRDRGRARRAALGRGRTPGHQEIRQRQAHRHLSRLTTSARSSALDQAIRPGSADQANADALAQAVRPQPYIRRSSFQYARLKFVIARAASIARRDREPCKFGLPLLL